MEGAQTTQLLREWSAGDAGAFDRLFPRVYDELKSIAHHRLARSPGGQTVNTTVLAHEAYLKLVDSNLATISDRAHFLAVASRAMRFILVDRARAASAKKRGGADRPVSLDDVQVAGPEEASVELIMQTTRSSS